MSLSRSSPASPTSHWNWKQLVALLVVLLVAGAARIPGLGRHAYSVDEMWTAEISTGRGSLQLHMPVNRLIAAPELFRLSDAPPWWAIWTHMEITHPPLYSILLRWWEDLLGASDVSGRALSVVLSLVGIIVFYDTVRLMNGPTIAFWAALLMALASPQVDYARTTRNYAMLVTVAMVMVNALVRIEKLGFSARRGFVLALFTWITLMTHYFCIGAILGLMVYAAARFSGSTRRRVLGCFVIAGLLFAILWGPFMWQQRHLFSTTDEATQFLVPDKPDHMLMTLQRVLLLPASLLFPPRQPSRYYAMAAAVLYVLPFVLARKRPELLLWGCWLVGTVSVIAALDFSRHTTHLHYPRYTLLAGPAVYVMLPALFANFRSLRWFGFAVPAVAAFGCAMAIPDVWYSALSDAPEVIHDFAHPLRTNDVMLFAALPKDRMSAELQYLFIDHYMGPIPCPVAVLTMAPDAAILDRVKHSDAAYLFSVDPTMGTIVPGVLPFSGRRYLGRGIRWRLK